MKIAAVIARRLAAQHLAGATFAAPADVVAWFGAVQAQDYRGALWGIGQRTRDASERDVERAIAERRIVRTWPMRGTLHLVAAADVHWLSALLAGRAIARSAGRHRELGLDARAFAKARTLFERALAGGQARTREEMYALLARGGIAPDGQRGIHVLVHLAMTGVLCYGTHRGRQPTFVLLDEWVPRTASRDRDDALAEVARRYFTSHGPATLADLAWWSGLPLGDARRAVAAARAALVEDRIGDTACWSGDRAAARAATVHLLPAYDEYTVAYRDRSAILDPELAPRMGNGIFSPVIVVDGRIEGTWRRRIARGRVTIDTDLVTPLAARRQRQLAAAIGRFATFVGGTPS